MEEQELIERLKNAESRNFAFNQLIRLYQERIYWHIRKMVIDHDDADDLVQDTFIKVWKNLEKVNLLTELTVMGTRLLYARVWIGLKN